MTHQQGQPPSDIAAIERLIQRFIARYRLQRAVHGALEGACLGMMAALVGVAAMRTGWADPDRWWIWALITTSFTIAGALLRALRPIDALAAAQTLDRTHDLHDRLSTAIALAKREDLTRHDRQFVAAQLRDALRFIDQVDPRRAAPWRRPPDTRLLAILAIATIATGLLPTKDHRQALPPPFQIHHDAVLDELTLAIEQDRLDELRRQLDELPDEKAEQILDEIQELLDAVKDRQLTERQFLEAIDDILARHFDDDSQETELETMADVLAQAAQQVQKEHEELLTQHPELQEALSALEDNDLSAAARALEELAEKLQQEELSQEDAERLADLFESFADKIDEHQDKLQEVFEKNRDLFEELSKQFEDQKDNLSQEQQDLLNEAEQAMKDAEKDRDDFDKSDTKRRLETLARHLTDTAEETRKGSGDRDDVDDDEEWSQEQDQRQKDGQDQGDDDRPDYQNEIGRKMDDAARELDEMDKQRQRAEQRQQARRQLEEMRETMARQDRGEDQESDQRRGQQMQDFMDRARGEEPDEGDGDGENQGQQQPQGSDPAQSGDEDREGQQQDRSTGQDQNGDGDNDGEGDEEGHGQQAGTGGPDDDDRLDGKHEEMDAQKQREVVQATESAEGRSRSEIIQSAGQDGFATVDYRDVFVDYEAIAEEVMEREEVPDGYRFYIKRYFQLIRPQDR